jgi:hypothetical protein
MLFWASAGGCRATSSSAPVTAVPGPHAEAVPSSGAAVSPSPRTADQCKAACNGVWDVHGIAAEKSCNCRTRDGGKRCRDGADCQGMCITAEEPEREIVEEGPPTRGFFVGRCSDVVTVFGCNRQIAHGAAARGPVSLTEPPPSMCVD